MDLLDSKDVEDDPLFLGIGNTTNVDPSADRFDTYVGALQDFIGSDAFNAMQLQFIETHAHEFEDTDENKIEYMPIFKSWTAQLEVLIDKHMREAVDAYDFGEFMALCGEHEGEVDEAILEVLTSLEDFETFKQMMLDYNRGRALEEAMGVTVRSLSPGSASTATAASFSSGSGMAASSLSAHSSSLHSQYGARATSSQLAARRAHEPSPLADTLGALSLQGAGLASPSAAAVIGKGAGVAMGPAVRAGAAPMGYGMAQTLGGGLAGGGLMIGGVGARPAAGPAGTAAGPARATAAGVSRYPGAAAGGRGAAASSSSSSSSPLGAAAAGAGAGGVGPRPGSGPSGRFTTTANVGGAGLGSGLDLGVVGRQVAGGPGAAASPSGSSAAAGRGASASGRGPAGASPASAGGMGGGGMDLLGGLLPVMGGPPPRGGAAAVRRPGGM